MLMLAWWHIYQVEEYREILQYLTYMERLGGDPLPDLSCRRVNVETWHPQISQMTTRFYPDEILAIHHWGGFPETIILPNRAREDGRTALAIYMARLATPSCYFDLSQTFGRELSIIGRICRAVQSWIYENWGSLLQWDPRRYPPNVLEGFATSLVQERNCPMDNCVGFLDGTVWRMARPKYNQRAFYNGHKRVHSLKYQAAVTPDGITANLTEAYIGSRHDTAILRMSGLSEVLERNAKGFDGRQMMLYGDQGYQNSAVLLTPYVGLNLGPEQAAFNWIMASVRVAVEHELGRLRNIIRMTQYKGNLRFYVNELNQFYHCAVIMKNFLVCCGRGPLGGVAPPPTLDVYLAGRRMPNDLVPRDRAHEVIEDPNEQVDEA
ncbi:uncharacterized protein MELLADRAFT_72295 [Melampsora larici-populina 98AG31]|uniref:DDE Tnp4 domain-containing protein n=1 Tax=Melampsora larici-populina (strain 98AG31 / pathotype 3-4-7) TaxID=747676 RepID=F4RS32_MELLP|nr:uncharacterized protein MELLADRAFT_72295 [Melampsora larici-populina 98AG31]EGG04849.1 hypothetical protein MELLADRAFT_72295 [Melampsora larici-populina 98AG31]